MSKTLRLPERSIFASIRDDLSHKMVFLGGPRQVGKTTLAQSLLSHYQDKHPAYFNWDDPLSRDLIRRRDFPTKEKLILLDEIHKAKDWRNIVKGLYDTLKNSYQFMVTGSARLDHFRRGGDSLLGRYYYYRLHPYSLPELGINRANTEKLLNYGGFPEPLASENPRMIRRWHLSRLHQLVKTDVRDLENIQNLDKMELLAGAIINRSAQLLSYKSLAEDLEIDPKTCKKWVEVLDSLYFCYRLSPYGAPKIKAVKKEQKIYLWDWSQVPEDGHKFENLVAGHLLKYCHYHEDVNGYKMDLRYIRDFEKREVDFVVLKDSKPLFAVECKLGSTNLSESLNYIMERSTIPKFYQVHLGDKHRVINDKIEILPFESFVKKVQLV